MTHGQAAVVIALLAGVWVSNLGCLLVLIGISARVKDSK